MGTTIQSSIRLDDGTIHMVSVNEEDPASANSKFAGLVKSLLGNEAGEAFLARWVDAFGKAGAVALVKQELGAVEQPQQEQPSWRQPPGPTTTSTGTGDAGRPPGPAPECQHGPKVWKNPDNKPWKGWFCSANQRDGACKTQWV